jgi:hypothetical protein
MAAFAEVKVCICVVATHSSHTSQWKNTGYEVHCSEDPEKAFHRNLLIDYGSRIMGLRVCEDLLSCPHVHLMV